VAVVDVLHVVLVVYRLRRSDALLKSYFTQDSIIFFKFQAINCNKSTGTLLACMIRE
jgi:hypothetical protein